MAVTTPYSCAAGHRKVLQYGPCCFKSAARNGPILSATLGFNPPHTDTLPQHRPGGGPRVVGALLHEAHDRSQTEAVVSMWDLPLFDPCQMKIPLLYGSRCCHESERIAPVSPGQGIAVSLQNRNGSPVGSNLRCRCHQVEIQQKHAPSVIILDVLWLNKNALGENKLSMMRL